MGTHNIIVVRHSDFEKISTSKTFGDTLQWARPQNSFIQNNFLWLGEFDSQDSLAIFHYDGIVWSPRFKKIGERSQPYEDFPPEQFWVLDISGDFAHLLERKKDIGAHMVEALSSFTFKPNSQPVYVEPYDQAIAIVNCFSSERAGIAVLERNCSWVAGKDETPSWAKALKKNHPYTRELLELCLALKHNVNVNLTLKRFQKLAQYF